jgi:threonyl-tRNA synthetase
MIDIFRPLEEDCELTFANFQESKSHFWHSSAHILGAAVEQVFDDALLTVGPSTKDGFFYDFFSQSGRAVHESDYA